MSKFKKVEKTQDTYRVRTVHLYEMDVEASSEEEAMEIADTMLNKYKLDQQLICKRSVGATLA
jgi:phosphoribosylformylglycinamidine (FGAM) synthase PurS component